MERKCSSCEEVWPEGTSYCGQCGGLNIELDDPDDPDPRIGASLGELVLVARVADGAMGRVYEGRRAAKRERVAVKVLHDHVSTDQVAVERFRREYETAAELNHPNVVSVMDMGATEDGIPYMVMEYLEGRELRVMVEGNAGPGNVALPRLLRITCQAAGALDHAHSFGFIHRDLKPDNIFLSEGVAGEQVKILDFGSVKHQMEMGPKLTAFGTTLGSPSYMSPEQAMGKQDIDQRSDVFALTAIIYECLAGRVPFEDKNVARILMKIINEEPESLCSFDPKLPAEVDDAIARGLHKQKTERPESCSDLAGAICTGFGLNASPAHWAEASEEEIRLALDAAPQSVHPPVTASGPVSGIGDRDTTPADLEAQRVTEVGSAASKDLRDSAELLGAALGRRASGGRALWLGFAGLVLVGVVIALALNW